MRWIAFIVICGICQAADKPVVTMVSGPNCPWCDIAKRNLDAATDLPFTVKITTIRPGWFSSLPENEQILPTFYWDTHDQPRRQAGWGGTQNLIESWRKTHVRVAAGEDSRSSRWPALRNRHITAHPNCIACGGKATTVHHLRPFHLRPDLELDPGNLRSMCDNCHLHIGHLGNFQNENPDLDQHADMLLRAKQAADLKRKQLNSQ